MKFRSERHPNLVVHDLGVRFVGGEADVDGKAATELRKLPEELGVSEVGGGAGKDTEAAPKTRKARAE